MNPNQGGQSFPYSITSLEEYSSEKCLNGSITFYNLYQVLGFFHLIDSEPAVYPRNLSLSSLITFARFSIASDESQSIK